MKIVIAHRYFWPTLYPYALMLKDIAESFANSGHDVKVVAPCDSDEDAKLRSQWAQAHGIELVSKVIKNKRASGGLVKALDYVSYLWWLNSSLHKFKVDLIWVATTPPVISAAMARRIAKRNNCQYLYHCQDIHPESAQALGSRMNNLLFKSLLKVDKRNIEDSGASIVLSSDMANSLRKRGCQDNNVFVQNNYLRDDFEQPSGSAPIVSSGKAANDDSRLSNWIFAGSLGYFQNLDNFLKAFLSLDSETRPNLLFLGDGPMRAELEAIVVNHPSGNSRVSFAGRVDPEEAQRIISMQDVGLVSLVPGVIDFAYPSKSINYLGAGVRLLCLLREDSDLGQFVESNNIGWVTSAESVNTLSADLQRFATESNSDIGSKNHTRAVASMHFSSTKALARYVKIAELAVGQ